MYEAISGGMVIPTLIVVVIFKMWIVMYLFNFGNF